MRAVFSLITVIFVVCVSATVTSFKEIPLDELNEQEEFRKMAENERAQDSFDEDQSFEKNSIKRESGYGAVVQQEVT